MSIRDIATRPPATPFVGEQADEPAPVLTGTAAPVTETAADEPAVLHFVMFRGPADAKTASSAATFTTEEEARAAMSALRYSADVQLGWAEVVRVGGGTRPAVLVWFGRPFPPIAAEDALSVESGL